MTTIQNADHIYVLENGCVCEDGTHDTLMTREGGKYQGLVRKQHLETIQKIENDDMDVNESEDAIGMSK